MYGSLARPTGRFAQCRFGPWHGAVPVLMLVLCGRLHVTIVDAKSCLLDLEPKSYANMLTLTYLIFIDQFTELT